MWSMQMHDTIDVIKEYVFLTFNNIIKLNCILGHYRFSYDAIDIFQQLRNQYNSSNIII